MDRKPPITEQEFDLLERVIHRASVGESLVLEGDDVETARRLRDRGDLRLRDGRPAPNDAGLIAASDYEHDLEGSDEVRDPLTAEEFELLARISEGEMSTRGPYQLDPVDLPLARYLASRRLVHLEDRCVELERRGHRAVYANRERVAAQPKPKVRPTTAGEVLEAVLGALANEFSVHAISGLLMRQRQELGRMLQLWAEAKSPLDLCGARAWKLGRGGTPELRELEGIRCGSLAKAPLLTAAGLAEVVDGSVRLTARPHCWHITQSGHLRVDGQDVASGATLGLRSLGTFLHDMGYPPVRGRDLRLFRLGQPGEAHALVGPAALSEVTTELVGQLAYDGGTAEGAGVYLGLSGAQWRRHAGSAGDSAGPWATRVLRYLPAHPRVITWVLELEEPLGRAVVGDILEHLARLGLAAKRGADWHRTAEGAAATDAERVDPYDIWVRRHHDELGRLENGGADFLTSLRHQLRRRARDVGRDWYMRDTVRSRHLSSVLRQAAERRLGHGCELAHALWSRRAHELVGHA